MKTLEAAIAAGEVVGADQLKRAITPDQQLRMLQANPQLAQSFLADDFGEQRFRPGFEQLVMGGSAYQDYVRTLGVLTANRCSNDLYLSKVHQSRHGTAQIEEAQSQMGAETGAAIQNSTDSLAAMGNYRTEIAEALTETRSEVRQWFMEPFIRFGELQGRVGIEEIVPGINVLRERRRLIANDGITPEEAPKIKRLDAVIQSGVNRLSTSTVLASSPESLQFALNAAGGMRWQSEERLRSGRSSADVDLQFYSRLEQLLVEQVQLQREMLAANQGTQNNTKPRPPRTQDAQRAMAGGGRP